MQYCGVFFAHTHCELVVFGGDGSRRGSEPLLFSPTNITLLCKTEAKICVNLTNLQKRPPTFSKPVSTTANDSGDLFGDI